MKRKSTLPEDVERRLFDFSTGPLRLLDTTLAKAGQGALATRLRDLIVAWRAYPSLTTYTKKDLEGYAKELTKIAAGLRRSSEPASAEFVAGVTAEIRSWTKKPRKRT